MKQPFHVKGVQYAQHAHAGLKQPTQHPTMCRTTKLSCGVGYCGGEFTLPIRLTTTSSFYKRYFRSCLPMPLYLFGPQQDGASSHYGRCVRDHLSRTFPNR
ncbi:hypothetical protein TNCT_231121 [Trichonephila clavata]|uniref:Uncharacterized protein n=1 Tax=Trichonephila clavata TaxID=2740835 RepID=A0A8X6HIY4_TRICU|nr:hypothetical protein TNCT_231121 [Trichonephila clavata]